MLKEFFDFYALFDFQATAVSVARGQAYKRVDDQQQAMYIENPLDNDLNVSKNVNEDNVCKFQLSCQQASKLLEDCSAPQRNGSHWGLLRILDDNNAGAVLSRIFTANDSKSVTRTSENKTDNGVKADNGSTDVVSKESTRDEKSSDLLPPRIELSGIFSDGDSSELQSDSNARSENVKNSV